MPYQRTRTAIRVHLPDSDKLLVGYSGGKDSLAVLDLAVRSGKEVVAFFMYFIPDLDYSAFWCDYAEARWGVKVIQLQNWNITHYLRNGIFCEPRNVPSLKIKDVEAEVRKRTGFEWIGYGFKRVDSIERNGRLSEWPDGICEKYKLFAPLKEWTERDVFAYLSRHNIETPDTFGGVRSNDINLGPASMAYMKSEWPGDYQKILKVFPYAQAQAARHEQLQRHKNEAAKVRVPRNKAKPDTNSGVQPSDDLSVRTETAG